MVIDRRAGPALETSFANGAVLHPGLADPWNSPGVFRDLLRNLGREDSAMLLRVGQLPNLLTWGLGFIRHSRPALFRRNALHAMRLSSYSLQCLRELREQLALAYQARQQGVLVLYRDLPAIETAAAWARGFAPEGKVHRRLAVDELLSLEPALQTIASQLSGALYYPDEESGDSYEFCVGLERHLRTQGVVFRYDCEITAWRQHTGKTDSLIRAAVDSGGQEHVADRFLIAAGSYSTLLASRAGLRIPVRPAKGYSITVPRGASGMAPNIPVVDNDLHVAVVPLGPDKVRVAGTAEFAGYDTSMNQARIRNLVGLLERLYPRFAAAIEPPDIVPWTGLRPMCNEGVPVVGAFRRSNLYFNTGHGQLGWTMAAGSGRLAADLLLDKAPGLDPNPYSPNRF